MSWTHNNTWQLNLKTNTWVLRRKAGTAFCWEDRVTKRHGLTWWNGRVTLADGEVRWLSSGHCREHVEAQAEVLLEDAA